MKLPSIEDVNISEKKVLIRTDFDVPLGENGEVLDDSKILYALPTIKYALSMKAMVIIASTLGNPGGEIKKRFSLEPVGRALSDLLDCEIFFPESCVGDAVKRIAHDMFAGSVMLLENLAFHEGEESNDPIFAQHIASNADVYVNEAFSCSNKNLSSIVTLPKLINEACFGLGFIKEIEFLDKLLLNPEKPFLFILGGNKTEKMLGLIKKLLDIINTVAIGGQLSNTFLKVVGRDIGRTAYDRASLYNAGNLFNSARIRNVGIMLPTDSVAVYRDLNKDSDSFIISTHRIPRDATIVDIGSETIDEFTAKISKARTVLWLGELGAGTDDCYLHGTLEIAKAISDTDAFTYVAGVETLKILKKAGLSGKITHRCIGEDAVIEYINNRSLPGLESIGEQSE